MVLKTVIDMSYSFMRDLYQKWLPSVCILCGYFTERRANLCHACQNSLPSLPHHCTQCAQFLFVNDNNAANNNNLICGTCLKKPPPFNHLFALFPYQPPITQLITQLKFHHQLSHAQAFAELFIEKIPHLWYKNTPLPDLLIPIPLHFSRLRERGFNQAVEIAKPIANAFSIPLDLHHTLRIKKTAAQSGLLAAARKQNVAQAFVIQRNYAGLHIAVMDDVVTTGHTIMEFCACLKQHGAQKIDVWCVARRG